MPKPSNDRDLPLLVKGQMAALETAQYKSETYRRAIYIGQLFGVLAMLAGFILSIAGVAGSIDWIVESNSLTGRLTNATPGVFFVFVGMLILWRYKPKISTSMEIDRSGKSSVMHSLGAQAPQQQGPRSRLSVDAVRRLQEEVERVRIADEQREAPTSSNSALSGSEQSRVIRETFRTKDESRRM